MTEVKEAMDDSKAAKHDLTQLAPLDADEDHHFASSWQKYAFISLVCFAQAIFQINIGSQTVVVTTIARELGVTGIPVWLSAPYPLGTCASIFVAGMLGDIYGHRNLLIGGYAAAIVWLIVLGTTTNQYVFIVSRALLGCSVGFIIPASAACIAWAFAPGQLRVLCLSLYGGLAPTGFVLGAVWGSLCAEYGHYHWIYRSECILTAALALESFVVVPAAFSRGKLDAPFDFIGAAFGVTGMMLFLFSITHSIVVGWLPFVYILLIIGVVLFAIFIFIETRTRWPILPLCLLGQPALASVIFCMILGWLGYAIINNNMPTLIIVLRGHSELNAAAQMSPQVVSSFVSVALLVYFAPRISAFYLFALSMAVFAIGALLLSFVEVEQAYWRFLFPGVAIAALGPDLSFGSGSILFSEAVPRQYQGIASSWVNLAVNVSLSIGQALGGIILVSVYDNGTDLIHGIRAAEWFAMGAAAAGFLLVVALRKPLLTKSSRARDAAFSTAGGEEKAPV